MNLTSFAITLEDGYDCHYSGLRSTSGNPHALLPRKYQFTELPELLNAVGCRRVEASQGTASWLANVGKLRSPK